MVRPTNWLLDNVHNATDNLHNNNNNVVVTIITVVITVVIVVVDVLTLVNKKLPAFSNPFRYSKCLSILIELFSVDLAWSARARNNNNNCRATIN